jgi:hypothetical protein
MRRIHIFNKYAEEKSLSFRMMVYLLTVLLLVTFLLIRPILHFVFLVVVFGLFYKNIVSYSRALFSLYFSKIKFGDQVTIGEVTGTLDNMNFGGLHLLTNENKVYFPFNMWTANRIVLESESGTVLIALKCSDTKERNDHDALRALEKSLFNYPFLAVSKVNIVNEGDIFKIAVRISDPKFKGGLENHIEGAGFHLHRNKI